MISVGRLDMGGGRDKNKVRNKIETQPLQTALEQRMTGARLVAAAGREMARPIT